MQVVEDYSRKNRSVLTPLPINNYYHKVVLSVSLILKAFFFLTIRVCEFVYALMFSQSGILSVNLLAVREEHRMKEISICPPCIISVHWYSVTQQVFWSDPDRMSKNTCFSFLCSRKALKCSV